MNYNNVKFASIVGDMKNLRILYMEGNELTYVPAFHDENDVTSFRLDLRQVFDSPAVTSMHRDVLDTEKATQSLWAKGLRK